MHISILYIYIYMSMDMNASYIYMYACTYNIGIDMSTYRMKEMYRTDDLHTYSDVFDINVTKHRYIQIR